MFRRFQHNQPEDPGPAGDAIHIHRLQLDTHIGVPEAERAEAQRLEVNLTLTPQAGLSGLGDDIAKTIDYAAVCAGVRVLAASRPRKLVETLAEEICAHLLADYPLAAVKLELRKFILPETEYIAIRLKRERVESHGGRLPKPVCV